MMAQEEDRSKTFSSLEKSIRTYLLLTKVIGLIIGAMGVVFFLLTFNLVVLIILLSIGVILFAIGSKLHPR